MDYNGIKNLGIGIGFAAVSFGVYSFIKSYKAKNTPGTDEQQEAAVKAIKVDAKKLVKDSFYYKNIADQLSNELGKRVILTNIFTYNSTALFSYLNGLNTEELKQVAKEFGVRSLKLFNLIALPDGGTLFEWFDNILTQEHIQRMRGIWKATGLWQQPAPSQYANYFTNWLKNTLDTLKVPNARLNKGVKVYSTRTGGESYGSSDFGWWDINSYTAKKGKSADFYIRPGDAIQPFGELVDVYKISDNSSLNGKPVLIKVKITHTQLFTTSKENLANREVWVFAYRLTDVPYKPPLNGLNPPKRSPALLGLAEVL